LEKVIPSCSRFLAVIWNSFIDCGCDAACLFEISEAPMND
jgi:hypothetical protein